MTPLRTAQAIAALAGGGGGGGSITVTGVAYVDATAGNDGTGAVGDPALPYATAQAAYTDGARTLSIRGAAGNLTIGDNIWIIGRGSASSVIGTLTVTTAVEITDLGMRSVSIGDISANGCQIAANNLRVSGNVTTTGLTNGAGGNITATHCFLGGAVDARGGVGQDGADASSGVSSTAGSAGGNGGAVILHRCDLGGTIATTGGTGGTGGEGWTDNDMENLSASDGGAGGNGGTISLFFCKVQGEARSDGGNGGSGGLGSGSGVGVGGNGGIGGTGGPIDFWNSMCGDIISGSGTGGSGGSSAGNSGSNGVAGGVTGTNSSAGTITASGSPSLRGVFTASDNTFHTA